MPKYGEKKKHFCIENDLKNQSFCITNPCTCDTRTNSDLQGQSNMKSNFVLYYCCLQNNMLQVMLRNCHNLLAGLFSGRGCLFISSFGRFCRKAPKNWLLYRPPVFHALKL